MKLTDKELVIVKMQLMNFLLETAGKKEKVNLGRDDKSSIIYRNFSLQTKSGKAVYKYLTDEELLYMLTRVALKLGHSPSQNEVLWIFKIYIKKRFGKWPYALTQAYLPKSSGSAGPIVTEEYLKK